MPMNARLLRPRAAGGFDPTRVSDLAAWFDAKDTSTVTLNGSNVSEWRSKVGGVVAAQTVAASQPAWSAVDGWGNVPTSSGTPTTPQIGLTFNAAGRDLARNASGVTLFVVHRPSLVSLSTPFSLSIGSGGNPATARLILGVAYTSASGTFQAGGRTADTGQTFASVNGGTAVQNTKYIQSAVFDYANSDLFLYVNNSLTASTTSFQTSGNTVDTASEAGGVLGTTIQRYGGSVAEVIFYRRVLSAAERLTVDTYLSRKWGVTLT